MNPMLCLGVHCKHKHLGGKAEYSAQRNSCYFDTERKISRKPAPFPWLSLCGGCALPTLAAQLCGVANGCFAWCSKICFLSLTAGKGKLRFSEEKSTDETLGILSVFKKADFRATRHSQVSEELGAILRAGANH